jgi:hypothetical protein
MSLNVDFVIDSLSAGLQANPQVGVIRFSFSGGPDA